MEEEKKNFEFSLPAVTKQTAPALQMLVEALGIPRNIIASDDEIQSAWTSLPRVLRKIPRNLISPALAKMCVAVASGLFDSAINYVWNAAIIELREKVKRFGLNVVQQLLVRRDFDEKTLLDLKDAQLLSLCLQLNLITEEGYFFLDQSRDVRNTFSAAHPPIGTLDDTEFVAFVNRCAKYALGNEQNPIGVDTQAFIAAVKGKKFIQTQLDAWVERLANTHEAQRGLLFTMLHGIYCDSSSQEENRVNALSLVEGALDFLTPKIKSELIDRHQEYVVGGVEERRVASHKFFEKLGLIMLLSEAERHYLISTACKNLKSVHQAFDNFYNEPPFAERLYQLSAQGAMPDSVKEEFVETILMCAVGNSYGVSNAAVPFYENAIKNFSPAEVLVMMHLPESKTVIGDRIRAHITCQKRYKRLVALIDKSSVPTQSLKYFEYWMST